MDMELLSVHYESVTKLVKALKAQGVKNIHEQRNKGLTGKAAWLQFEKNYQKVQTAQGKFPLTYEVVYGHAWKGERRKTQEGGETIFQSLIFVKSRKVINSQNFRPAYSVPARSVTSAGIID